MRTGRPPSTIQRLETKVRLRPEILGILDLLCLDPMRDGHPKLGERTRHFELALTEYLQKHYPSISAGLDKLAESGHSPVMGNISQSLQEESPNV